MSLPGLGLGMSTSPPHPEVQRLPSSDVLIPLFELFSMSNSTHSAEVMDLSRILAANIDGRTQNTRYRQSQLQKLQSALVGHIADIQDAIHADSGHTRIEVRAEIVLALQELRAHYSCLSLEKDLSAEYRIAQGKDNPDGVRGVGIVYIVPSVHTPFYSIISALSAALAAGNCVILEVGFEILSPCIIANFVSYLKQQACFQHYFGAYCPTHWTMILSPLRRKGRTHHS